MKIFGIRISEKRNSTVTELTRTKPLNPGPLPRSNAEKLSKTAN